MLHKKKTLFAYLFFYAIPIIIWRKYNRWRSIWKQCWCKTDTATEILYDS